MSEGRKPKLKDAVEDGPLPNRSLDDRNERERTALGPLSPEQVYLRRKAEVTRQDNEAFSCSKSPPAINNRRWRWRSRRRASHSSSIDAAF